MSVSMVVVDSDSLLVERKDGTDCAILMPVPSVTENADAQSSSDQTESPVENPPHTLALTAFSTSGMLTPRQVIDWVLLNDISEVDTGLMTDICDELMIIDMTAVCLMSHNTGFIIHHVKKSREGEWDCRTVKGDVSKYGVVTTDGCFHICDRFMSSETPGENAILTYATYARHNDDLSNNFDQYTAVSGEIIENATI